MRKRVSTEEKYEVILLALLEKERSMAELAELLVNKLNMKYQTARPIVTKLMKELARLGIVKQKGFDKKGSPIIDFTPFGIYVLIDIIARKYSLANYQEVREKLINTISRVCPSALDYYIGYIMLDKYLGEIFYKKERDYDIEDVIVDDKKAKESLGTFLLALRRLTGTVYMAILLTLEHFVLDKQEQIEEKKEKTSCDDIAKLIKSYIEYLIIDTLNSLRSSTYDPTKGEFISEYKPETLANALEKFLKSREVPDRAKKLVNSIIHDMIEESKIKIKIEQKIISVLERVVKEFSHLST